MSGNEPRTVLVTGAGRGIGRAIAVRLARSGWRVYGGVRTDAAATTLTSESDRITPVQLDVTIPEHVAALDAVLPHRLDALVNNTGIAVAGPVETLGREAMHHQFDVNLVGPLAVTRAVLPRIRASRGRIVFVSSLNGRVSFPFTGLYNASKFAVEATADCLRVELRPWGIRVVLVEPGVIDTDPWQQIGALIDELEAGMTPEHRALYARHLAGERAMVDRLRKGAAPPDTVARAVERALTRRRPRARVLVGRDARMLITMRTALPASGLDWIWARGLGLTEGPTARSTASESSAQPRRPTTGHPDQQRRAAS
jgi:NAD(P)-dependent dehydrogenase (short-subunit alcohol dehydrogenase family)